MLGSASEFVEAKRITLGLDRHLAVGSLHAFPCPISLERNLSLVRHLTKPQKRKFTATSINTEVGLQFVLYVARKLTIWSGFVRA